MTGWRQVLVSCVIVGLAVVVTTPPVRAFDGESEELRTRLTEIGLRIERCLHSLRHDAERGQGDRTMTAREVESASTALDGVENRLRGLPVEDGQPLFEKLRSIRLQLGNLQRAAARPETVPPSPTKANNRIVHKGRSLTVTDAPPANDDCSGAFSVGFGTFAGSTAEATNDGEATCGSSIYSPDSWYRFIADTSAFVVFTTMESSYDAVLSVHSECPGTMANEVACNDDALGVLPAVGIHVSAGSEYLIRESGVNGDSGSFVLNITAGGEITGRLTERLTSSPIGSVRVEHYDNTGYYLGSDFSDSDGVFEFAALASGEYFVGTDIGGNALIDELYDDRPCPGGPPYGCDPTTGDAVTVVAGSQTAAIDFDLDAAGAIAGVIREEVTGQAIEGARIGIFRSTGDLVSNGYSDSAGQYGVGGLAAGTYFVVVSSTAWADEAYDDLPCPGGAYAGCDPTQATPVAVELNTTAENIDFDLDRLASITGSITDRATGNPIAYADILLYNESGVGAGSSYADSSGHYEIGGMADGTYFVVASEYYEYVRQLFDGIDCPASGCLVISGTPVVISDQATVAGIDFGLIRRGAITGTVIDETTSLPAAGVRVRVYSDSGSSIDYNYSDSDGIFVVTGLFAGTYFVATDDSDYVDVLFDDIACHPNCDPTDGTPVSVSNGVTTGGIDFDIAPMGRITGSVVEEGSGLPISAEVKLYRDDGVYIGYDYTGSGEYWFSGLGTGNYFLVAESTSYYSNHLEELYDDFPCWNSPLHGCNVTTGTPVAVVLSAITTDIDFALERRALISGHVEDAVSLQGVNGRVYIEDPDGNVLGSDSLSSGDYVVSGLFPGTVKAVVDTYEHVDQVWNGVPCNGEYPVACATTGGTSIAIGPGDEIEDIDFSVGRLGFIGGVVRDAVDLQPLWSWVVRLFDGGGNDLDYDYTTSDGSFEFSGLWPGTYFVATDENVYTYTDQLFQGLPCPGGPFSGCDPTTGTPLALEVGSIANSVNFALERAASISGVVTDESTGVALPYCRVQVWNDQGVLVRSDDTDSYGVYLLQGLSSGTYFVGTAEFGTSSPDYIDELYDDIPCIGGPPYGCDATKGLPVVVAASQTLRFVDFALTPRTSRIIGLVSSATTGAPVGGIRIDLWNTANGQFEASTITNAAGTYLVALDAGTYVAATDNAGDWINQIFDGRECPVGSAYNGDCDPMAGDPIVVAYGHMTDPVDFDLQPNRGLFEDGFESGDTDAWSGSFP